MNVLQVLGIRVQYFEKGTEPDTVVAYAPRRWEAATGYRGVMWQALLDESCADVLGHYEPLIWLPRKTACFLFEYHDTDFRGKVPQLPALPAPQDRDEYLDVHKLLKNKEVTSLLQTLTVRKASKDDGHFRLFGTLSIGHPLHPGYQRVQCWPFKDLLYYGANRQNHVIVRPPNTVAANFKLTPDSVWYCKVLLLFYVEAITDSAPKQYRCADVSVLEQQKAKPDEYGAYDDLRQCGSRVIYEQIQEVGHWQQ
jgi:hypothetical protein